VTLDQDSLAILALTNRLVETDAAPLKASEFWRLVAVVEHPARLLGLDESAVAQAIGGSDLAPGRIVRLLDTGIGLAVRIEGLHERGVFVLTAADERYPAHLHQRLGTAAPAVLYFAGDAALLGSDGIGVVGSAEVGADDREVTVEVAHRIARAGLTLVCGGAPGLDSIAMTAAYDAGGTTVAVLADSLERAIGRRDHRAAVRDGRALLCTPYRPDAEVSPGNARGRTKIVYGLSRVTVVITTAEGEGVTWAGATEALNRRFGRVAVWSGAGAGPGNAALVTAGGIPIERPEQLMDVAGPRRH
jgi:predicted Rossmann fold nucleotide-binding protein DprA/Smf involved in DNA uptake